MENYFRPFGSRKALNGITLILASSILLLAVCECKRRSQTKVSGKFHVVTALTETKPMPRNVDEDAADDPAIWINFRQPDSSRIIGTDKKGGIAVYDLSGNELFYYNAGELNNVDLRYGFPVVSGSADIIAASNRTDLSVNLFRVNSDGSLSVVHKQHLMSQLADEVYGLCMYHSILSGIFYVFVNNKFGVVEQWELFAEGDSISGKIVRNLKLNSQVEGMVADDEAGLLYVGEEDTGIWKFHADPDSSGDGVFISFSGNKENGNIVFDIEGLAIYTLPEGEGYLIASSQGNDSYAVFERKPPNRYLGSFKITKGGISDGAEETDGLDVTSFPVGKNYPAGLLVVQDGHNDDNGTAVPQNFKFVRWDSIALKFSPTLRY